MANIKDTTFVYVDNELFGTMTDYNLDLFREEKEKQYIHQDAPVIWTGSAIKMDFNMNIDVDFNSTKFKEIKRIPQDKTYTLGVYIDERKSEGVEVPVKVSKVGIKHTAGDCVKASIKWAQQGSVDFV